MVDHDLADFVIGEKGLQRSQAQRLVEDVGEQFLAIHVIRDLSIRVHLVDDVADRFFRAAPEFLVAEAVQEKLDEIAARNADTITVTTVSDLSDFIEESTEGLLREGGLGAVFAILTIFLFLWSVRSTLVAAISIPLSILTALVVMQIAGISLNIMTLGGLAVAVGRVVDDAIVVLENIYRHRALGEDRLTASINGPREVAGAITAATVTTVGVFLPLGFVGGIVSQLFLPFARFSTRSDSTGLGLAICRTIVEAHGGAIDYSRIAGGRTRFRVRIPAR